MREVLPGRREEADVDGAEERDDVVARPGAEESHAVRDAERRRLPLEAAPLRPVAHDEELDAVDPRDGLERVAERLLGREAPAVPSAKPWTPSAARASSRDGSGGSSGAGFGTTVTRDGVSPQPRAISRR